jgi:hypothetical protein
MAPQHSAEHHSALTSFSRFVERRSAECRGATWVASLR